MRGGLCLLGFEFLERLFSVSFRALMLWLEILRTTYEYRRIDKKYGKFQEMKQISAKKLRNTLLFSFGINSGLRIADILSLDVKDVKGKDYIELREKKTNKYKKFPINENLKVEIEEFIKDKSDDIPLFYTQKHYRLDRAQAYRIINKAARMVGGKGRI